MKTFTSSLVKKTLSEKKSLCLIDKKTPLHLYILD